MYKINHVDGVLMVHLGCNGSVHAKKCWCCGRGRPIQVPYLYLRGHGNLANKMHCILIYLISSEIPEE